MYPEAKDVDWEKEGRLWSVSFETGSLTDRIDHDALFDTSGNWIMTETDIMVRDLPQSVKDAVAANAEYGKYCICNGHELGRLSFQKLRQRCKS
jgi:hypothetical protein